MEILTEEWFEEEARKLQDIFKDMSMADAKKHTRSMVAEILKAKAMQIEEPMRQ